MSLKHYLRLTGLTVLLTFTVLYFTAVPLSCRLSEDGIEIISAVESMPKILSFKALDNSTLSLVCSKPFELKETSVKSEDELFYEEEIKTEFFDEGKAASLSLSKSTQAGSHYVFEGIISDKKGNSLTFSLPFTGFNENPARLLLTEVRTKHSTSSSQIKKSEYVEVYVLSGGSTAGLEIICGSDGEAKKYEFPVMEVKKGEYITVHYRLSSTGDCIDETGGDLELSSGADSSSARDLWINNTESRISESDVIVIADSCRDLVMDGLLYSVTGKTDWYYSYQKVLALKAFESGLWSEGALPENACAADGLTLTRTMSRLNTAEVIEGWNSGLYEEEEIIPCSKNDWAVVSGATPGGPNSDQVYVKE